MVEIFDINRTEYNSEANFWQLCDLQKFDTFNGISFVSNLKFIERYLLPRFKKINLILGLSDNGKNPIGQFMQGILDNQADMAKKIYFSDELKKRILDGTLTFRFTKKANELIHSKFYLLTNDNSYSCFIGSMNLTDQAVNKNHEMLAYFTGNKSDNKYQIFNEAWNNNWKQASEYLDATKLSGIYHDQEPEKIEVSVYDNAVDMLSNTDKDAKNVYVVDKQDIKDYKNKNLKHFRDLDTGAKIALTQTVKITGDSGALRQNKTLENIAPELITVKQKLAYVGNSKKQENKVDSDLELFPQPIMTYNQDLDAIYTSPKLGDDMHMDRLKKPELTFDNVSIFPDIVNEYETSKLQGEGQQAFNFLLYLFESPFLWKIRQMYEASSSVKAREDVPIGAILIGNGRTGKSQLGAELARRLVGENSFVGSGNEYFGNPSRKNQNLSKFVQNYLRTAGPISPLLVDDTATEYFTKDYFISAIKDIANDKNMSHPAPAVIYSTNLDQTEKDVRITNKPEVMRRMYYLGFESPFKANQDKYINNLLERAEGNHQLFDYVQFELNKFFSNVDEGTERKIEKDYLYPVKTILIEVFKKFDLYNEIAPYFKANYDFIMSSGKRDWETLVESATYRKYINFVNGGKIANFPKEMFKQLSNNSRNDNGTTVMKRYFNNLPRKYEISSNVSEAGFDVNVDNFDKYIGYPVLQKLYEDKSGITAEKQNSQMLKDAVQSAVQGTLQELNKEKENQELNKEKPKKHGFFSWFKK